MVYPRTTTPRLPSTRISSPSIRVFVAPDAAMTAGIPYSRAIASSSFVSPPQPPSSVSLPAAGIEVSFAASPAAPRLPAVTALPASPGVEWPW